MDNNLLLNQLIDTARVVRSCASGNSAAQYRCSFGVIQRLSFVQIFYPQLLCIRNPAAFGVKYPKTRTLKTSFKLSNPSYSIVTRSTKYVANLYLSRPSEVASCFLDCRYSVMKSICCYGLPVRRVVVALVRRRSSGFIYQPHILLFLLRNYPKGPRPNLSVSLWFPG